VEPILRWLAGVVAAVIQPIRYFSRLTHPASSDVTAERRADGVVEGAQAVVTATADAIARPTTVKSFTAPVTTDVMVDPDVNRAAHIVLDGHDARVTARVNTDAPLLARRDLADRGRGDWRLDIDSGRLRTRSDRVR